MKFPEYFQKVCKVTATLHIWIHCKLSNYCHDSLELQISHSPWTGPGSKLMSTNKWILFLFNHSFCDLLFHRAVTFSLDWGIKIFFIEFFIWGKVIQYTSNKSWHTLI